MPVDVTLPEVPGDPAGMRALASALRTDATGIAVLSYTLGTRVDAAEFYGPAADRIEGRIRAAEKRWVALAERLLALSRLLEVSATQVEIEQRERERKLAELRRELAPQPTGTR
jgi:hypothetical protein